MVRVRGIAFIGAMQFVKEEFGPEAHARVLEALPEASRATFGVPLRDAVWKPLDDLAAYAGTARRLLAPEDDDFYAHVHSSVDRSPRLRALRSVAAPRAAHDEEPRQMRRIVDGG